MIFTVLISCMIIALSFFIDITMSKIVHNMIETFGGSIVNKVAIFMNADAETKTAFCEKVGGDFEQMKDLIGILNALVIFSCVGYLTAVI